MYNWNEQVGVDALLTESSISVQRNGVALRGGLRDIPTLAAPELLESEQQGEGKREITKSDEKVATVPIERSARTHLETRVSQRGRV